MMGRPKGSGVVQTPTTRAVGLRRRSGNSVVNPVLLSYGVDLVMECEDEPLSASQLEAARKEKDEYKKSIKKIEAARAAVDAANVAAAAAAAAAAAPPPPSPARNVVSSHTPDIMIVGETPAQKKLLPAAKQFVPAPGQVAVSLPMTMTLGVPTGGLLPAPLFGQTAGSGSVVPGQVFRLVNSTSNAQSNQWFLRPMTTAAGSPQQPMIGQKGQQHAISPPKNMPPPTVVSGTSGLGIKRPTNPNEIKAVTPPLAKKSRGRSASETEVSGGGNWVPLDEYYYGKMEGDPVYNEQKSEFRFKCWMCTKMLYNNIKAMMHLQGHIDTEKQQNLDLSDLTQCKHCYQSFDTPFEMQTHIEKTHLHNMNVLMCRICEKDHETRNSLTTHMRHNHCACEMPYVCQLCNFRSSMYVDVVDHFKKKHDSSDSMLCLYCLRVFHIKFVSQGWGQTQTYYAHLLRHQSKSSNKKCTFCKLYFFNSADMKMHRKTHHQPNQKGVIGLNAKHITQDQVMICLPEAGLPKSGLKSLNAPTSSKVAEHRGLRLPHQTATSHCLECKMLMNTQDHYKKYIQCSMCRFATSCGFGYATHMLGFHSCQTSAMTGHVTAERLLDAPIFCICGFSSKLGNRTANHLVFCSKRTCYLTRPEPQLRDRVGLEAAADPRLKPDASILDILGLVKKPQSTAADEDEGEATAACDDPLDVADKERKVRKKDVRDAKSSQPAARDMTDEEKKNVAEAKKHASAGVDNADLIDTEDDSVGKETHADAMDTVTSQEGEGSAVMDSSQEAEDARDISRDTERAVATEISHDDGVATEEGEEATDTAEAERDREQRADKAEEADEAHLDKGEEGSTPVAAEKNDGGEDQDSFEAGEEAKFEDAARDKAAEEETERSSLVPNDDDSDDHAPNGTWQQAQDQQQLSWDGTEAGRDETSTAEEDKKGFQEKRASGESMDDTGPCTPLADEQPTVDQNSGEESAYNHDGARPEEEERGDSYAEAAENGESETDTEEQILNEDRASHNEDNMTLGSEMEEEITEERREEAADDTRKEEDHTRESVVGNEELGEEREEEREEAAEDDHKEEDRTQEPASEKKEEPGEEGEEEREEEAVDDHKEADNTQDSSKEPDDYNRRSQDTESQNESYNDSYGDHDSASAGGRGDGGSYVDKLGDGERQHQPSSESSRQEESDSSRWRQDRPEDGAGDRSYSGKDSQSSGSSSQSQSHHSDRGKQYSKDQERSYDRNLDYKHDRYDRDRNNYDRQGNHDRQGNQDRHYARGYDRNRDQRYDNRFDRHGGSSRDRDRYYDQNRQGGQNRNDRNYHRGYY